MEKYVLNEDITVFYVAAKSFPDGVVEAFQTIEKIHPSMKERIFYGISNPDQNGKIMYRAAVTEAYEGEGASYGCPTFIIKKGEYMTETIHDFMSKVEEIGLAFQRLLTTPQLDLNSSCIEWYKSPKEVVCMVRLNTEKNG